MISWTNAQRLFTTTAKSIIIGAFIVGALSSGPTLAEEPPPPTRKQIDALKSQVMANSDSQALTQLEALAETSAQAMAALGELYSRKGLAPDQQAKAAVYYERALSKGDKTVRTRLGLLYRDGIGVPANPDKARDLLKSAAEDGDRWAMFHLAQGHLKHQFGSASQPSEAVELLEESMNAGNPNAVAALSNLYMWGRGGVRRDPKRAVALLEAAADKGNAVAARNLIAIYRDGRGRLIPRDRRRASALLQKYANLFDPDALRTENLLTENNRTENSSAREALAESYIKADPATRRHRAA